MRKNFGAKTWLYPMPVLIVGTYDENGNPNAMNAAWGGIYDTNQVMICLSDDHKTTDNIKKTRAFTVSFATAKTVVPCDYVGIVSAHSCHHTTLPEYAPLQAVSAPCGRTWLQPLPSCPTAPQE